MLDPDGAADFPNEDDITLLASVAHRSRLPEFRADLEGTYASYLAGLPDGPDLSEAERVSKIVGVLDHRNVMRPAARPGLAFVGDAALACDPLFGVGLSFAFQSAEWLADEVAPALVGGGDIDAALERYRRLFRRRLGLHHLVIAEFSSGRRIRPAERRFLEATAASPELARAVEEVGSRRRQPLRILDPRLAPHVVRGLASSSPFR
jgi:flavin-dependent dehydrogenase